MGSPLISDDIKKHENAKAPAQPEASAVVPPSPPAQETTASEDAVSIVADVAGSVIETATEVATLGE